jgi:hypothetical protein
MTKQDRILEHSFMLKFEPPSLHRTIVQVQVDDCGPVLAPFLFQK